MSNTAFPGFVSTIFLVQKKDGGTRPIINLRELNQHLVYEHFKMEGIHLLQDLLKPDIGKHPLGCSRHLYRARLINYRAI